LDGKSFPCVGTDILTKLIGERLCKKSKASIFMSKGIEYISRSRIPENNQSHRQKSIR
jgi:hypothetical protein